ncbi:MAG: Crp/Fnr family transcriptional regulator, partial [Clostridia bacterium]|nr:Crp/Fnr family transcriptional regulator [Clostridia bacterium]
MKITTDVLKNLFLFEGLENTVLSKIEKELEWTVRAYPAGQDIYSPEEFKHEIGFVLDGECAVERIKNEGRMQLNILKKYASFGVLAAFLCDEEFPTAVRAKKASVILFITRDQLQALIKSCPEISLKIINFMGERISFLNKKIATFSSDNVEQKISYHLVNLSNQSNLTELKNNYTCRKAGINFDCCFAFCCRTCVKRGIRYCQVREYACGFVVYK